ncbi:unnamed protein product [Arabis nemorensis]|uniref:Uncharacterized protein n=1 Tax=Arabis nemorensis TaxID=586526 RepID=A0A565AP26_9BRAS|nr:unnamed protein product [Arabis nemorensis]
MPPLPQDFVFLLADFFFKKIHRRRRNSLSRLIHHRPLSLSSSLQGSFLKVWKYVRSIVKPEMLMTDIRDTLENSVRKLISENGLQAEVLVAVSKLAY